MTSAASAAPSPALIFDSLMAFHRTTALKAGIDLDVFTAIAEGANTTGQLAARTGASEKGLRVLCDYLTISGFLIKTGDQYSLTPDSNVFLNRHSPACMASIANFLASPDLMRHYENLADIVRKGGTLHEGGTVSHENPVWVLFARAMAPMMAMPAEAIASAVGAQQGMPMRVLDIAAGHGLFGIAIARQNPNAHVTAVDWPQVLEVAGENARSAGIADRYYKLPGDAFEVKFDAPYDVVLITNFLHHFDKPTCEAFLRKVRSSLAPGGRAVTLEFVPNEDRVSPPPAAGFAMVMLGSTPSGDAYTWSELETMFANAGFSRSEKHEIQGTPQTIVISHNDGPPPLPQP